MTNDMTQGKPAAAIMRFAIPLFIGSVFQQVYNMVDSIVVGRFVGKQALAAVGSCAGAFSLMIALITGLTNGMSVVTAQYFGAKKQDMVRKTFISSTIVILLAGVVISIAGVLLARPLLLALKTPADVIDQAEVYLVILFVGTLANCLYNGLSAVLRALGDSVMPLVILVAASLLNVVLDLVFVLMLRMDVPGVAVATVLAQLISAAVCLVYVFKKLPMLRFGFRELKCDPGIFRELVRIGFPAALSSCGVSLSVMFMQRAINGYGSTVMAGYTIGNRAENIGMCLAFSIGMAVGTFCGQNMGAGQRERVKQGLHVGYFLSIGYAAAVAVILIVFARPLAGIFNEDQMVLDIAVTNIRITALFAPVLGLVFVYQNFLRSVGDVAPTVWMSVTEIAARSVLAFLFSGLFGYVGIWWATPVGWTACAIIGYLRYRSGVWAKKFSLQTGGGKRHSLEENPEDIV